MKHLPNPGKIQSVLAWPEWLISHAYWVLDLSQTHKTVYGVVLTTPCVEEEAIQDWCCTTNMQSNEVLMLASCGLNKA